MQRTGIRLLRRARRVIRDSAVSLWRLRYTASNSFRTMDGLQVPSKSQKGARNNKILEGFLTLNFEGSSAGLPVAHVFKLHILWVDPFTI